MRVPAELERIAIADCLNYESLEHDFDPEYVLSITDIYEWP